MTVRETAQAIAALDKNDPDFEFKVTAAIKRCVHSEKYGLVMRMSFYSDFGRRGKGRRQRNKVTLSGLRFMKQFIEEKMETHLVWAALPDDEIVTWGVGRHEYSNGKMRLRDQPMRSESAK